MQRRTFLKESMLAAGAAFCAQGAQLWGSPAQALSHFKLGAISDGFSQDLEQALKIMKRYGLSWVEIRAIWGKYNTEATPKETSRVKELLDRYGFKCSVVDSALFKCTLPGTKPVSTEKDPYPYSGQMDLLKRAAERCHAWGTDKVRGFTFWRVAEPEKVYSRVSEELAKAAEVARQQGVRLVIENEESCNAATGHETAAILKMTPDPNLGFNWDVGNGYTRGEVSYPDGYNALAQDRIWHLHLKGVQCGRAVLHSLPIGYSLDAVTGIREPRGMVGRRLGVDMHTVTAEAATIRNLMLAVERCHLTVEAVVASPYAGGLAVLADDEADLGSACVDLGAGTTTLAVFSGGRFVHAEGFALGGRHVTMDLARGLNTRIADAERIKAIYGSVLTGGSDERDMITVPPVGDDEREPPQFVSRAQVTRIVRPRIEEILEMVRDRLAASPFAAEARGRVVLTGGGSQVTGLAELAAQILRRPVRIGRPLGISGLPEAAKSAAFAVAAGLLVYPQAAHLEHFEPRKTRRLMTGTGGYMARVGQWLRESF